MSAPFGQSSVMGKMPNWMLTMASPRASAEGSSSTADVRRRVSWLSMGAAQASGVAGCGPSLELEQAGRGAAEDLVDGAVGQRGRAHEPDDGVVAHVVRVVGADDDVVGTHLPHEELQVGGVVDQSVDD